MACSREFYPAVHSSGARLKSQILWVCVHDEEALTARSAAAWFRNPASGGSAHVCVDDKECYRCLSDNTIPWAASNANTNGLHLELAGYAAWPRWRWIKRWRTLRRGARVAARWCKNHDIPPNWRTPEEMHAQKKGLITHATVSVYTAKYGLAGDRSHTDPGPNFPKKRFRRMVKRRMVFMRKH
jgi:N-acetyl-anhydromuramyl-L-alanine amidase AmpD